RDPDDGARPVSPSREYQAPLAWRGAEVPAQAQRQRCGLASACRLIGRPPVKHPRSSEERRHGIILTLPCVSQRPLPFGIALALTHGAERWRNPVGWTTYPYSAGEEVTDDSSREKGISHR